MAYTLVLSILILSSCALLGKRLLSILGLEVSSATGLGFILGYGLFGMLLLVSLKYFGTPTVGACIFVVCLGLSSLKVSFFARLINKSPNDSISNVVTDYFPRLSLKNIKSKSPDIPVALVIVSWIGMIGLTTLPFSWAGKGLDYQFADIYDLPKHLFALQSLFNASDWPPPNPFFQGEAFAYNYLFYYPPAFIAKLTNNPTACFQTFSLVVLAVALALPMAILDIARNFSTCKFLHLICVLLCTWGGGLTPLWLETKPSIGFFLYSEKLLTSPIWVDELFQSLIFIPQHIFATLCGLTGVFILTLPNISIRMTKIRILMAGTLIVIGALCSLILLPHLIASYLICGGYFIYLHCKNEREHSFSHKIKLVLIFLLPLFFLLPFLIEIFQWAGNTGALTIFPTLSAQWFYVVAALGLVLPLAVAGLTQVGPAIRASYNEMQHKHLVLGITMLAMIGAGGILFGGYPDAGIKSGLWLRIVLIPLAGVGLSVVLHQAKMKAIAHITITSLFIGIAILNFPTAIYFLRSAWTPLDPNVRDFINEVRNIPKYSRIALLSSDQVLVALAGREIDFDFSPIRDDSYMPPDGRRRAATFWNGLKQNDPKIWEQLKTRYDYVIAVAGSPLANQLSIIFLSSHTVAGFTIFTSIGQE